MIDFKKTNRNLAWTTIISVLWGSFNLAQSANRPVEFGQVGIRTEQISEYLVRAVKDSLKVSPALETIPLQIPEISQELILPANKAMTLQALGAKDKIVFSAKDTLAQFPLNANDVTVKFSQKGNTITFKGQLTLRSLDISLPTAKILIPQGLFNSALILEARDNRITTSPNSIPLVFEVEGTALFAKGMVTPELTLFNSNIANSRVKIAAQFGKLYANGKELEITIGSSNARNGSITIDEESIRKELQNLATQLIPSIQRNISITLSEQVFEKAKSLKPTLLTFDVSDQDIAKMADRPEIQQLTKGLGLKITPNQISVSNDSNLVTSNIQTQISWNGIPVQASLMNSPSTLSVSSIKGSNLVNVLIRENGYQEIINNPDLQKRIAALIQKNMKKPGVKVGAAGLKFHAVPGEAAVAIVLNLEIDIGHTLKSSNSWSKKARRRLGNWIETHFGSGEFVKVPIEMWVTVDSLTYPAGSDQGFIKLKVDYPFRKPTFRNTFHYPSNLSDMVGFVRSDFFVSLEEDIREDIPEVIVANIPRAISAFGSEFQLSTLKFNPDATIQIGIKSLQE